MISQFDAFMQSQLQTKWKGSILMPMSCGHDGQLHLVDLCDYVGSKKYEKKITRDCTLMSISTVLWTNFLMTLSTNPCSWRYNARLQNVDLQ